MTSRIDLFDSTYSNFSKEVLQTIRGQTFGRDIGQNSWLTADEYDRFISWLRLLPGDHALEVASGSGGPARYLAEVANCHVTGIDASEHGVKTANESAAQARTRVTFQVADANTSIPFADNTFDARRHHRYSLAKLEGEERFEGLQKFFAAVRVLTSEQRLSRIVYLVEKVA